MFGFGFSGLFEFILEYLYPKFYTINVGFEKTLKS